MYGVLVQPYRTVAMATPLFFGHCSEALVLEVANVGDFLGPNSWGMGMGSSCKGSGLPSHWVFAEGLVADGVRPVMTRDQRGLFSGACNGVVLSWDRPTLTQCLSRFVQGCRSRAPSLVASYHFAWPWSPSGS